jgi:hypothetical protein
MRAGSAGACAAIKVLRRSPEIFPSPDTSKAHATDQGRSWIDARAEGRVILTDDSPRRRTGRHQGGAVPILDTGILPSFP